MRGRRWYARYDYAHHQRPTLSSASRLRHKRCISYTALKTLHKQYGSALGGIFIQTGKGVLPASICVRQRLGGYIWHLGS
jgi:ribosomal protein S8